MSNPELPQTMRSQHSTKSRWHGRQRAFWHTAAFHSPHSAVSHSGSVYQRIGSKMNRVNGHKTRHGILLMKPILCFYDVKIWHKHWPHLWCRFFPKRRRTPTFNVCFWRSGNEQRQTCGSGVAQGEDLAVPQWDLAHSSVLMESLGGMCTEFAERCNGRRSF